MRRGYNGIEEDIRKEEVNIEQYVTMRTLYNPDAKKNRRCISTYKKERDKRKGRDQI